MKTREIVPDGQVPESVEIAEEWIEFEGSVYCRRKYGKEQWGYWEKIPDGKIPFYVLHRREPPELA